MLVRDRAEAGRQLTEALLPLHLVDPVVLGLPRGGVPVGFEIAQAMNAPLDVLVVRKLGVPHQEELAMGAVGEDGVCVLDQEVIRSAGVREQTVERIRRREQARVAERAAAFRAGRTKVPLAGRTLILVDDGVATGSSMLAACRVGRASEPARIVVAAPVAPRSVLATLHGAADDVVCLHTPHPFMAVGLWYHDFTQVGDDEVLSLLTRASPPQSGQ
jgi:predicted phosphoribosyltransferase